MSAFSMAKGLPKLMGHGRRGFYYNVSGRTDLSKLMGPPAKSKQHFYLMSKKYSFYDRGNAP